MMLRAITFGGMGDRIRLMLSAYHLAKESGRQYLYSWPLNSQMGAHFSDLFVTPHFPVNTCLETRVDNETFIHAPSDSKSTILERLKSSQGDVSLDSFALDCGTEGFGNLVDFKDDIKQYKEDFVITSNTIGVHVRATDFSNELPPIDHYFKAIDSLALGSIFLATDDPAIYVQFLLRYGRRIVNLPNKQPVRNDRFDTIFAATQLWILRQCERLVLSAYSGYSGLAVKSGSLLKGRGIKIILNNA
jgi:hypothetical protein